MTKQIQKLRSIIHVLCIQHTNKKATIVLIPRSDVTMRSVCPPPPCVCMTWTGLVSSWDVETLRTSETVVSNTYIPLFFITYNNGIKTLEEDLKFISVQLAGLVTNLLDINFLLSSFHTVNDWLKHEYISSLS